MPGIIADHIKGKEIPPSWFKKRQIDPEETFRVTLEPEREINLTKAQRKHLLDAFQRQFTGDEDSEKWINEIASARTRSELKVPLK